MYCAWHFHKFKTTLVCHFMEKFHNLMQFLNLKNKLQRNNFLAMNYEVQDKSDPAVFIEFTWMFLFQRKVKIANQVRMYSSSSAESTNSTVRDKRSCYHRWQNIKINQTATVLLISCLWQFLFSQKFQDAASTTIQCLI